jgi:hypothetical protein
MCRAKNRELLTTKDQVLSRRKEHFELYLNEGDERDQPPDQGDFRDVGNEIDLPSREENKSELKYLKKNKAAGADSIAVELLKNGGPQLVDALEEVIQLAWTTETLPESWTNGVLCRCLTLHTKSSKKYYTTVCYPTPTWSFSITKLICFWRQNF